MLTFTSLGPPVRKMHAGVGRLSPFAWSTSRGLVRSMFSLNRGFAIFGEGGGVAGFAWISALKAASSRFCSSVSSFGPVSSISRILPNMFFIGDLKVRSALSLDLGLEGRQLALLLL